MKKYGRQYEYRRIGTMHYSVRLNGEYLGSVWRTLDGWRTRSLGGEITEFGEVSRDVAASALVKKEES